MDSFKQKLDTDGTLFEICVGHSCEQKLDEGTRWKKAMTNDTVCVSVNNCCIFNIVLFAY